MNIPFTMEQFLKTFETYNVSVRPMPWIALLLGGIALILVLKGGRQNSRGVAAILAVLWVWNGAVYHIGFFSRINGAAYLFGALFIAQGLLLFREGVLKAKLQWAPEPGVKTVIAGVLIGYATAGYPLVNFMEGIAWGRQPMFGIAPCPTTIFTFGLLMMSDRSMPKFLVAIPFLWSLIGLSAALHLDITADYGLILAGLTGSVAAIFGNEPKKGPMAVFLHKP